MEIDTFNVDIQTNASDLKQLEANIERDTHEQKRYQNNVYLLEQEERIVTQTIEKLNSNMQKVNVLKQET